MSTREDIEREEEERSLQRLEDRQSPPREGRKDLTRPGKVLLYNTPVSPELDTTVVTVERYGCFGANLFPGKLTDLQLTAGVTSARPREGKSLVASNLAAFFATDTRDDTVLVDLSFRRPRLHQIFGIPSSPGLLESVRNDTIILYRSAIKNLWILPLGFTDYGPMNFDRVVELREALSALKRRFRFILLDLPAVLQADFPAMISSQLDGYFLVVAPGRTKITDVKQVVQSISEKKVIGFIMNKARG
jgi:Mrp family chromosome partitioning ATPase